MINRPDFHPKSFSSLKARFQNSLGLAQATSTKSGITLQTDMTGGMSKSSIVNQLMEPKKLTKNELK